ncbi:acyl carrier protein [Spirillospora sp. NPDC047279]|uniref:acyl carrier protein n=1 Tax=Spirillospora sp. NPDC047279 TaxID=3155478 RepID=UPI0033C7992A
MSEQTRTTELTVDELLEIMRECAGEDESVDLGGEIAGVDFDDLGYDSLALMETLSRVERIFGIKLPEEDLERIRTPEAFLTFVNERLDGGRTRISG